MSQIDDFLSGKLTPEAPSSIDEFLGVAPKKKRRDVADMTSGSVAQDIASGVLQIGPTAVKGVADIARLATGDRVGTDTSEAMERGMASIRDTIGSGRAAAQRENFQADMADDEVGIGETLTRNKGALADQLLPTIGSMFLPVGVAGAAGKLATVGKAAQAMDKATLVARVASAQQAAGIGAVAAQNAADTFAQLLEKGAPLEDAYLGAGITVPFSVIAGRLTGGGAEGAITRALTGGAAAKAGVKQLGTAMLKEGGQEMGEEAGQITGEAVAMGEAPSAMGAAKQLAVAGTLGAAMGGGVDVATQSGKFGKPAEVPPAAAPPAITPETGSTPADQAPPAAVITPQSGAADPTTQLAQFELLREQRDLTPEERAQVVDLLTALNEQEATGDANQATPVQPGEQAPDAGAASMDATQQGATAGPAGPGAVDGAGQSEQAQPLSTESAARQIPDKSPAFEEVQAQQPELDVTGRPPASWVIKEKATGNVILETFDKAKVDALNTDKYEAIPIGRHLASLNKPAPVTQQLAIEQVQPTRPPTDFWSFAKSKGFTPSQITIGSPEHAALKAEYDALKAGNAAPVLPPMQPQQNVDLQNRDRGRAASVVQMSEIARNPDYMRLGPSRTPDSGAPMVFAVGGQLSIAPQNLGREDVAVMSDGQRVPFRYAVVDASTVNPSNFADGRQNPAFASTAPGTLKALNNGRTAGVRAAHEMGAAADYVGGMKADEAMHGIPADVIARTPNPMLVRVYADADNTAGMAAKSQGQGLGMSPTELARQDAPLLDSSVLGVYADGEVTSAGNRDFVRAFIGKLQGSGQDVAGMITGDGQLSQDGSKRIQAALMQAAYGDSNIVEEMFDSTDTDIKAIGEALKAVAGRWANMRDSARLGAISPEVDITQNLLQAIGLIRKARRDNTGLFDLVNQPDLMTGETPDAMTMGMLRLFYSGKYLTRAIGKDKLAQHLGDYMTGAMATSADAGMFGDVVTPADILATIINRITQGQGNAETQPQESREQPAGGIPAGRGAGEGGQAVGRPGAAEGRDGPDQDSAGQPGQDAQAGTEQQAGAGNQKAEEGDGAAEGRAGGGQQAEPGAAEPRPVAPKRANPAAKKTPKNTDPVAAIKPWRDRFEAAKTANDKDAIQSLHDKVRVYLNGPAQARGEAVVAQFEALRSDIEQFAEDVKTAAATAIQSSAEGKKDYKTTTTEAGPLLTAPTEAEVVARQDSADAAKRRAEADKRRADEEERTRRERADIAQASVAAADTFELGQDAMANPTGQQDIFGAPAEPAAPDAEQATGPFGPILTQFRGDAQGAIKALTKLQDGEAVAALNHPEVGDIDLVWGKEGTSNSDGLGLAKLAKRHPEVLGDLQGFLNSLRKDEESSGKNRIRLIGDNGKAVVRLQWDGKAKAWLLTAFENAPKGSTTTDTGTADVGGDTASPNPERNASVPLTTDEAQGKPATVENFGEKLPPARRAMAAKLSEDLTDDKIASMPLSQIWPATENDAIEDTFAAAVAHVMREAIPAKPRTPYKVKSWVGKVRLLRGFAADIMSGKVAKEKFVAEMGKLYTLKDILSKIKLLEQIDRADWARIGDVSEAPNAVRYEDNKQIPTPSVSVTVDGRNHWLRGSGDVADHLDGIKAMLGTAAPENKMQFEIRQESRGDRKVFINKKGDKEYRRLMTFDTVADARAAVSNQYTELVAAWEGVKSRDNITERDVRSDVNRDRTGKDHRKGKDVSAEDFESRFGFRGGEFGKWVKQGDGAKERQFLLNNAYDALMDLSDLLGIPPKAISLEGTLGIAFGSRGSGGAAAHFEPSNLVINLTKTRGAGSLAHEWFHALDNYFARKRGGEVPMDAAGQVGYRNNNYITHKTTPLMVRKDGRGSPLTKERLAQWRSQSPNSGYLAEDQWHEDPKHKAGVRVKVEQAFNDLVAALNSSPMLKRARVLDGVKESGDGYWSRTLEMAARSFENFVQTRMMEQGYHNDFLANVKAAPDVGKNTERYPYLMPNEIAPIASAFDGLFGTIQAKETADGNISLLSRGTATGGVAPKALESLVDGIRTKNPNLPKVNVLADPSQAPRGLREYINRQNAWGDVEGAMHDGELYLFASGLSDLARAEHVLIQHEAAHYGLRAVLGDKLTTAMNLVYANNGKVRKAATELQKRGKLTDAEAAEEVIVDIPTSELAKLTGWRKVVAMASEWLGAHGYNRTAQKLADWLDGSLTDQQRADLFVAELVQGARDYVAGKRPGAMDTGGTRLSAVSDDGMAAASAEVALQLRELAASAKAGGNDNRTIVLQQVTPQEADILRSEGVNVTDAFAHSVDMFAVRHALNRHGDPKIEKNRGQIAITDDDVARINEVVAAPTAYVLGGKTPRNQDVVGTIKRLDDGTILYLEEVRSGRKTLAMTSMRKYPGTTDFDAIANSVLPSNARSDAGDVRIVYLDESQSQGRSNSGSRLSRATLGGQQPQQPGPQNAWQKLKAKALQLSSPESITNLIYELQDKNIDLKNLREHIKALGGTITDLNDAYLGEELYHKRVAKRTQDFLSEELKPLLADLRARGLDLATLERYLHARHAPEANRVLAERNPNAQMIDAGKTKAAADVKALELQLQRAKAQGSATKAIDQALELARDELSRWTGVQAFKGTEAERLSLSGMSDAEAAGVVASLPPGHVVHLDALAARVDAMNAKTLDTLEKYGLMDKSALDAWRGTYQHYVPLHRDEAHPDSVGHPIGQGFSTKGDASKRRTGSNEKVTNILAHIAMQREAALTRGEKNRVAKKLYLMAAQNPDPDVWTVDKPPMIKTVDRETGFVRSGVDPMYRNKANVVMMRIGGRDHAIVFNERNPQAVRLAVSLKNQDIGDVGPAITTTHDLTTKIIRGAVEGGKKGTRWLASVNTQYNPVFGIINFARDVQAAVMQLSTTPIAGQERAVAAYVWPALKGIYSEVRSRRAGQGRGAGDWAKLWEDMQDEGGTTGFRELFAQPDERVQALENELKALDRGKTMEAAHAVIDWLSDYNEVMENAVRLAAYKVALDNGMSKERAASVAKNITVNFNRKGRTGGKIGAWYAFFNAAVQGTTRMVETLKGPAGQKIMLGGVMLGAVNTMLAMAVMGAGDDDDNWSKIPDFVKERSVIVPLGGADYIAIPMPLGYHVLPNIGRKLVEMAFGSDPTEGTVKQAGEMLRLVLDAFNPLGGSTNMAQMLTPTIADPAIALLQNKDWTNKPIYREDNSNLDPTPGHTRTKDSASFVSKWLSERLGKLSGGTDYQPGAINWTPDQIDYIFGQVTGGVGREALKALTTAQAPFTGDDLPPNKIPLVGRIYGNTRGPSSESERFYENVTKLNGVERELRGLARDGEDYGAYRDSEPLSGLVGLGNGSQNQISKLRQLRKEVVRRAEPGYQDEVRALNEQIGGVMKNLNQEVRRAKMEAVQ